MDDMSMMDGYNASDVIVYYRIRIAEISIAPLGIT